jgi:hypothetical protein
VFDNIYLGHGFVSNGNCCDGDGGGGGDSRWHDGHQREIGQQRDRAEIEGGWNRWEREDIITSTVGMTKVVSKHCIMYKKGDFPKPVNEWTGF